MQNQTGARRGMPAPTCAIRWWAALLTCVVGAAATATAAPNPEATYHWHGELVALDEAAGTVTVKSPAADPDALASLKEAHAGDRILITWSGAEGRANGIRMAAPYGGADLQPVEAQEAVEPDTVAADAAAEEEAAESARFLLPARFVAVDDGAEHLTFKASLPTESLGKMRSLKRGAWIRATTTRAAAEAEAPVLAIAAYSPSPEWRPAPQRGATFRWQGELVSLDEATGTLTVKSRVASQGGLAAVAGAKSGQPIVINWSGFESRASGIRSAMPDDGSGLWGSNRFLLRATFVEADDTGRYLTFETAVPAQSLATVRSLTRGSWASVTSPHHPSDGSPAVLSVDAYVPLRERRAAPLPGASYRWDGELLALDESTGTLTVKSRVASPAGLAAVAGAESGAPIVIAWSGYGNRASGIRAAMPDDDSGLWGSNRFLLRAAFVETDETGRYLTFKTKVPAESLATVRSLTRGSWASVRSPHHPSDGSPAVLAVDSYVPLRERRPAPLPGATYRWDGELVSLDESTGTLTVKSRVASPAGLAAVAGAESGAPIVITWSGYESRASGIRSAMPDDGSGLWGSNRFLLRATLVEADEAGRYLTFKTRVPAESLATVRSLTRGSWASVTSPHHPAGKVRSVMAVNAYVPSPERRPSPSAGATYRWDGELVSLDEATGMLRVRSRVASPAGLAAVADAQTGAPIVITWSGYDSQANGIRSAMPDDGSGLWGSNRFLLRATFVEADEAGRYLTFEVAVPETSLEAVRALAQGAWTSVTSPHHPADAAPAVTAVTAYAASAMLESAAQ
ncbi:MAG: hypothetical protein J4G16_01725 [Acidobacteria bacterium]|nr:hypothetical protein [Acidobacteriota bacterium]